MQTEKRSIIDRSPCVRRYRDAIPFPHLQSPSRKLLSSSGKGICPRANEVNGILLLLCFDIWLPFGQDRVSPSSLPPPLSRSPSTSLGRSTWPKWSLVVNTPIDSERFQAVRPSVRYGSSSHTSVMLSRAFHCRVGGRGCERARGCMEGRICFMILFDPLYGVIVVCACSLPNGLRNPIHPGRLLPILLSLCPARRKVGSIGSKLSVHPCR